MAKPILGEVFHFSLVLFFVAVVPFQVLEKVLDHRNQDHDREGQENGGFSLGNGYDWNDLEDADQQKVDCIG